RERRARTARAAAWLMVLATAAPWAAYGANGGLMSLKRVAVPEPSNLGSFVKDRTACVQLGKAFFWDMQAASDGVVACGTCHFAGGVDQRSKNTLHPGANKLFEKGAPNSTLT
ncbi:MAG: cytochrome C peroxidase, partial [Deltaproteobacteria bacterium]